MINKVSVVLLLTALTLCAGCSENEEQNELTGSKTIGFSVYSNITRAAQTDMTTDNLTSFQVTALGNNGTYFDNETFTKQTEGTYAGSWTSSMMYYWPNYTLDFYAYNTPATTDGKTATTDYTFTRSITNDGQNLYVKIPTSLAKQEDLVAACATGSSAGETGATALTFNHYLTQVIVKATSQNTNYTVKVYGVKLANMAGDGTYTFSTGDMKATEANVNSGASVDYIETYTSNPITLATSAKEVMKASAATGGKWYLIPQTVTSWDQDADKANDNNGTYLALYVAITTSSTKAKVFPCGTETKAWIAIPIDVTQLAFEQGKLYAVTVNFFKNGGAGYVEPGTTLSSPNPSQGEPAVIQKQITFTSTLNKWSSVTVNIDL